MFTKNMIFLITEELETKVYLTHDNGGKPFRVTVKGFRLIVERLKGGDPCSEKYELFAKYSPLKVFIPEFSPIWDEKLDYSGNTILFLNRPVGQEKRKEYIYIGGAEGIYSFSTLNNNSIVKYSSPVGTSDYPYPHAIDEEGFCYLMIEGVVFKPEVISEPNNLYPYDDYYRRYRDKEIFWDIDDGYEPCYFTYNSNPEKDYQRLFYDEEENVYRKGYEITKPGIPWVPLLLTKNRFCERMRKFGAEMGFYPLEKKTIHGRIW